MMEAQVTRKGTLYSCDCSHCGSTMYTHEWASWDVNNERDAMQDGTLMCRECYRPVDKATFRDHGRTWYAGRLSMPGYLDCTDWEFDRNRRRLERTLRDYAAA